jgi:hypothetical protein
MADGEDIQPLVCDNGTGMVKVSVFPLNCFGFHLLRSQYITNRVSCRLVLLVMMHQGLFSLALLAVLVTLVSW